MAFWVGLNDIGAESVFTWIGYNESPVYVTWEGVQPNNRLDAGKDIFIYVVWKMIFEPFSQADISTSRLYGGTGLGMTISHKIVELMGSNIIVESETDRGSTFEFTLDLRPQERSSYSDVDQIFNSDSNSLNISVIANNPEFSRIIEH